jgi:excisionase family DNA binding protein
VSAAQDKLLTRAEVARVLRVCTASVDRLIKRGELPAVRIAGPAGRVLVLESDLSALIEARRSGGKVPP